MRNDLGIRVFADIGDVMGKFSVLGSESEKLGTTLPTPFTMAASAANSVLLPLTGIVSGLASLRAGVQSSMELQTSLSEVYTLTDMSERQFGRLSDRVVEMSLELPQAASELGKGLYQTISAGVTQTGQSLDVLEISAKAAVGGVTDAFTAVDGITNMLNAYSLGAEYAEHMSDLLFVTVREGKTTFGELAPSIGKVLPQAKQLGLSLEEVLASVATLTAGGLRTPEAVTALRGMLVSLVRPSKDAKEAAEELGIEWNAEGARAQGLIGLLQEMKNKTGGNSEQIARLVPEVEAMTGAMALSGEQFDMYTKKLDALNDSVGASEAAYEKMRTGANAWEIIKNHMSAWARVAGDAVLPTLADLATGMTKAFGGLARDEEFVARERLHNFSSLIEQVRLLRGESDLTEGEQEQLRAAVARLHDEFPELTADIDLQKGSWTDISSAIRQATQALQENIRQAALKDLYTETFEEAARLQRQIIENNEALSEMPSQRVNLEEFLQLKLDPGQSADDVQEAVEAIKLQFEERMAETGLDLSAWYDMLSNSGVSGTALGGFDPSMPFRNGAREFTSELAQSEQALRSIENTAAQAIGDLDTRAQGLRDTNAELRAQMEVLQGKLGQYNEQLGTMAQPKLPAPDASVGNVIQQQAEDAGKYAEILSRISTDARREWLEEQLFSQDTSKDDWAKYYVELTQLYESEEAKRLAAEKAAEENRAKLQQQLMQKEQQRLQFRVGLYQNAAVTIGNAFGAAAAGADEGWKNMLKAVLVTAVDALRIKMLISEAWMTAEGIMNWTSIGKNLPKFILIEGLFAAAKGAITAFETGGLIDRPMMALMGEAIHKTGPELVAPMHDFKSVIQSEIIPVAIQAALQNGAGDTQSHALLKSVDTRLSRLETIMASAPAETARALSHANRGRLS